MARFNCNGVGIVNSITEAPMPPIEVVAAADNKAGYSLTNAANTEVDVTLVVGQELTLVNDGGQGYDAPITNSTDFTVVVNEQTGQGSQALPNLGALTISTVVENGSIQRCFVGNNVGANAQSGDTFTVDNNNAGAVLARVMIP